MKKSPLSRMNGTRYNRSPYGHKQFQNSNNYDNLRGGTNCHYTQDNSQSSGGSDYIPFDSSSPMSQRSNSGSWQGSAGVHSSSYRMRGTNYGSPISNKSSPYSSYNSTPKHNYKRQNFRTNSQRIVDITAYLDVDSMFENPWTELECQFNNSKSQNKSKNDSLGALKLENSSLSLEDSSSEKFSDKTVDLSDLSQETNSPQDL